MHICKLTQSRPSIDFASQHMQSSGGCLWWIVFDHKVCSLAYHMVPHLVPMIPWSCPWWYKPLGCYAVLLPWECFVTISTIVTPCHVRYSCIECRVVENPDVRIFVRMSSIRVRGPCRGSWQGGTLDMSLEFLIIIRWTTCGLPLSGILGQLCGLECHSFMLGLL